MPKAAVRAQLPSGGGGAGLSSLASGLTTLALHDEIMDKGRPNGSCVAAKCAALMPGEVGASVDPTTGLRDEPPTYHTPGLALPRTASSMLSPPLVSNSHPRPSSRRTYQCPP